MAHIVAGDSWGEMFPMYEIFADCVSPVHIAPLASIGVILEVEMILTVFIDHAVGVVHPAIERSEMIRRTIVIGVGGIECIVEFHQIDSQSIFLQTKNLNRSSFSLTQGEWHVIVSTVLCQSHIHPSIILATCIE